MLPHQVLLLALVIFITGTEGLKSRSRIFNGSTAEQGNFPQLVSIQHEGNGSHICGGTIVTPNLVLTAAHCLVRHTPSTIAIISSTVNLKNRGRKYAPQRFIPHDDFDLRDNLKNDIALIKVNPRFVLTDGEATSRLPESREDYEVGTTATVVGWGRTSQYQKTSVLHVLTQEIMHNQDCSLLLGVPVSVNTICAGSPDNGRGFCKGDSGGPVLVNGTQVGVISWYRGQCGNGPNIYTKVAHYIDWITANIGLYTY